MNDRVFAVETLTERDIATKAIIDDFRARKAGAPPTATTAPTSSGD